MTFTVYQATNPATPPEMLARMAADRPDLRQFVAANPATPPGVVEWLGTLGDHAVDAALARRRPSGFPPPSGPPSGPPPGLSRPVAPQTGAWAPAGSPAPSYPPADRPVAGTNPYAPPSEAGRGAPAPGGYGPGAPSGYGSSAGYGAPSGYAPAGHQPVSGTPMDAYGYQLPEPSGRRVGLVVAIAVAAVLIVGALVFAASSIFGAVGDDSTYGDDPYLDRLWDACEAGDGQACDDLYLESPLGSGYEEFGDTCGDRFGAQEVWCAEVM